MSSAGRRSRWIEPPEHKVSFDLVRNSDKSLIEHLADESYKLSLPGRQITVSENHEYDRKAGHFVGGGPFYTDKYWRTENFPRVQLFEAWDNSKGAQASTVLFCSSPSSRELEAVGSVGLPEPRSEDTSDLDSDGATAISLCSPVNPVASLGTGVSELLREGLPGLPGVKTWQRRTEHARSAGDEYLNAEFGWLPLKKEISDVVSAARHHRDILNQYHRDEGRNVRRQFDFPIDHESNSVTLASSGAVPHAAGFNSIETNAQLGSWSKHLSYSRTSRKWFSGAFTYGLPSQSDSWRRALGFGTDADKLYGIALSPDTVWELSPWSWAVDWFSNTGDVINNITNFELAGQVMRYGYMMEESIYSITVSMKQQSPGYNGKLPSVSLTEEHRSKVRRPANPFGFGLSLPDLSPTQILITAALGITVL